MRTGKAARPDDVGKGHGLGSRGQLECTTDSPQRACLPSVHLAPPCRTSGAAPSPLTRVREVPHRHQRHAARAVPALVEGAHGVGGAAPDDRLRADGQPLGVAGALEEVAQMEHVAMKWCDSVGWGRGVTSSYRQPGAGEVAWMTAGAASQLTGARLSAAVVHSCINPCCNTCSLALPGPSPCPSCTSPGR